MRGLLGLGPWDVRAMGRLAAAPVEVGFDVSPVQCFVYFLSRNELWMVDSTNVCVNDSPRS